MCFWPLLACTTSCWPKLLVQDETITQEESLEEIFVVASKNELGLKGSSKLDSVFGFEKDLLVTARSVNSYTSEFWTNSSPR